MSGDVNQPSPFRRPGFILAAMFLIVIALLGVIVAVTRGDSDKPDSATSPAATNAAATPTPGSTCRPTDTDQQVPTTAPGGVTWELFQAIALPTSPTAGPMTRQGEARSCFARTPTGALIAATQIRARLDYSRSWRAIADRQVVDGPGKSAFVQNRQAKGAPAPLPAGGVAQYAGFKFVTYSPDTAVIDLANRVTSNSWATSITTVKWHNGDWKLELQPDGSLTNEGEYLSTLTGYVAWGGA